MAPISLPFLGTWVCHSAVVRTLASSTSARAPCSRLSARASAHWVILASGEVLLDDVFEHWAMESGPGLMFSQVFITLTVGRRPTALPMAGEREGARHHASTKKKPRDLSFAAVKLESLHLPASVFDVRRSRTSLSRS